MVYVMAELLCSLFIMKLILSGKTITRRTLVIETASRAYFLSKGQRSEKLTTHFCPRAFRLKT